MKSKWETVGQVCVDSGTIVICDPCHLDKSDIDEQIEIYCSGSDTTRQLNVAGDEGDIESGVLLSTGYGDGFYDVEIRKSPEGRIAELRIKFM